VQLFVDFFCRLGSLESAFFVSVYEPYAYGRLSTVLYERRKRTSHGQDLCFSGVKPSFVKARKLP
jgi:hypothetical protein